MSDSRIGGRPVADGQDPVYEIARELVGVLPFGARGDTVARCTRLTERVEVERAVGTIVEAIESVTGPVLLPEHHSEPVAPAVVRRMLHVLLATRDLGWPGPDAPQLPARRSRTIMLRSWARSTAWCRSETWCPKDTGSRRSSSREWYSERSRIISSGGSERSLSPRSPIILWAS